MVNTDETGNGIKLLKPKQIYDQITEVESKLERINEKLTGFKENDYYKTDFGFMIKNLKDIDSMIDNIDERTFYEFAKDEGEHFLRWFIRVVQDKVLADSLSKTIVLVKNTRHDDAEARANVMKEFRDSFGKRFKSRLNAIMSGRFADVELARVHAGVHALSEKSPMKKKELESIKEKLERISHKHAEAITTAKNHLDGYKAAVERCMEQKKIQAGIINQELHKGLLLSNDLISKVPTPEEIDTLEEAWKKVLKDNDELMAAKEDEIRAIDEIIKKKRQIRESMGLFTKIRGWLFGEEEEEKKIENHERELKFA